VAKSTRKAPAKQAAKPASKTTTKGKAAVKSAGKPARPAAVALIKRKPAAKKATPAVNAKSTSTTKLSKPVVVKPTHAKPLGVKPPVTTKPAPVRMIEKPVFTPTSGPKPGSMGTALAVPLVRSANGKPLKSANGKSKVATTPTIIPPPPPPRSKPGKNLAGLTTRELEYFRDLLLAKRRELVGDMRSMESEALQRSGENLSNLPMHMADMGTDNYEQEFTLGLMEKDRKLLREINQALVKIMDGRYGICEGTGKPITKARLEVQPWAKYGIEHARKLENRGVR
jgi:RNA polymerase-binding protein DksA